ncbi:unnamed protein product [Candida parapsilosis]
MLRGLINAYWPVKAVPDLSFTRGIFICSIGNPEPEYKDTRHNVGHKVMDQLIHMYWKEHLYKQENYYYSRKYPNLVLFKSDSTLMNLQGKIVWKHFQQFRKQSNLIVLHDDLERNLGKFQVRKPGTSSRGHNGLKSIDEVYKNKYEKIAIGIGRPSSKSVTNYVLSKFDAKEQEILDFEVIPKVVKELECKIEADLRRLRSRRERRHPYQLVLKKYRVITVCVFLVIVNSLNSTACKEKQK